MSNIFPDPRSERVTKAKSRNRSLLISNHSQKLLKEMRDSGELCCIEIKSDYDYVWDVSFARSIISDSNLHIHEKPAGSFYSLNLAIKAAYQLWKNQYKGSVFKYSNDIKTVKLDHEP